MAMMAPVPTVPAMHEQVNDWAQQEQYVRQCTQKMSAPGSERVSAQASTLEASLRSTSAR